MDEARVHALALSMEFCKTNDIAAVEDMMAAATLIHKFLSPPSDTTEK